MGFLCVLVVEKNVTFSRQRPVSQPSTLNFQPSTVHKPFEKPWCSWCLGGKIAALKNVQKKFKKKLTLPVPSVILVAHTVKTKH